MIFVSVSDPYVNQYLWQPLLQLPVPRYLWCIQTQPSKRALLLSLTLLLAVGKELLNAPSLLTLQSSVANSEICRYLYLFIIRIYCVLQELSLLLFSARTPGYSVQTLS